MERLKDKIRRCGKIASGNVLKVDSFLNHQMDIRLFEEIGQEFKKRFADVEVNKILTIEASGIGIACMTARYFDVPVVFAKKNKTKNIAGEVYTSQVESFTHGRVYDIMVSKEFLGKGEKKAGMAFSRLSLYGFHLSGSGENTDSASCVLDIQMPETLMESSYKIA